ncbi:MAG: ABC transporter permease [Cyclobacteriaceae bacterium]|nr:ABC transporter permease [Cyclobacteriaceae bacterium]
MLFKIAWKNVWRSRGRSLVVIGSIVVGIWALLFGTGFMNGFLVGYMANIINNDISNIQIHNPEFKKDYDVKYYIKDGKEKAAAVRTWQGVRGATTRTIVSGMISSPKKAAGVQIRGIDLTNEAIVTHLDSLVAEGTYFVGINRNPIIIGSKLAENLGVKVRSKVVLTFNDGEGNITAGAFRVVGIVKSSSIPISELYAYTRQSDLTRLLGIGDKVHEIAVVTDPQADEQAIVTKYNTTYPGDQAQTWRETAPELAVMDEMYGSMLYVLMTIIMIALVFGIVNTMLMAVLERFRELGMLMAVGMNKLRVFVMILVETIFLGLVGAPIGLFVGWSTLKYYAINGVDLSKYSEGLESFGYSSILHPYIDNSVYFIVTIGVVVTAVIGALYPAWKAVKLKPVEALHKL